MQKLKQYAVLAADGHVNENPGFFPGQSGGGRVMGDTTTIWLLEMLEIYQHTGEMTLLLELWPQVQRAATWQIKAAAEIGLPFKLEWCVGMCLSSFVITLPCSSPRGAVPVARPRRARPSSPPPSLPLQATLTLFHLLAQHIRHHRHVGVQLHDV